MTRFIKNRTNSLGQEPGSLIHIGRKKVEKSNIRLYSYNENDFSVTEKIDSEKINDYLDSDNHVLWFNLDGLHEVEQISTIGKKLCLSPMILEDIMNTDERPRLTEDGNNIVIILKCIFYDKISKMLKTDQITIILGKNFVFSIQELPSDYFNPVIERITKNIGRIRRKGSDYLCYSLIDCLVDRYITGIEMLGNYVEQMDMKIMNNDNKINYREIYKYKTELAFLRKAIRPLREIMIQLFKSESGYIDKNNYIYFRDLDNLVLQELEIIETYDGIVSNQWNIYNTLLMNKTNQVMKTLAIISTIFIPLSFIAGVFGTNFDNLPGIHQSWGFYLMLGGMLLITIFMLIVFKRRKWL